MQDSSAVARRVGTTVNSASGRVAPFLLAAAAAVGILSTFLIAWSVVVPFGGDWDIMRRAAAHLATDPYESGTYVYTPIFTYLFAWGIEPLGWWAIAIAHVLSLLFLRDRLLAILAVATPAFWMTVALGNVFWFSVLFGILALRGSRWASFAAVVAFALVPRPLLVPLMVWLVWQRPWLRWPAAVIFAVAIVANLATGYADSWMSAAVTLSGDLPWENWNWGPTRLFGPAWLVLGLPLSAWLTRRGNVGLAGMALSPYLVPPYFLVLLLEVARMPAMITQPGKGQLDAAG